MKATLSVGIIGAGPGGIALGILLARAGFRDFTIFIAKTESVELGGSTPIPGWPVTSSRICIPTRST